MILLLASCIALILGPLFVSCVNLSPEHFNILKMLIVAAVAGLVVCHIVPHAVADAGALAIPMTVVGLVGPLCAERIMQDQMFQATHHLVVVFVLLALGLHGFVDGAALIDHQVLHVDKTHDHEEWLGLGIVLHRIPLGLTLWWITKAKFGKKVAASILIGMMLVTALGCGFGLTTMHLLSLKTIGTFQALMGGAILHIVVDEVWNNKADIQNDTAV